MSGLTGKKRVTENANNALNEEQRNLLRALNEGKVSPGAIARLEPMGSMGHNDRVYGGLQFLVVNEETHRWENRKFWFPMDEVENRKVLERLAGHDSKYKTTYAEQAKKFIRAKKRYFGKADPMAQQRAPEAQSAPENKKMRTVYQEAQDLEREIQRINKQIDDLEVKALGVLEEMCSLMQKINSLAEEGARLREKLRPDGVLAQGRKERVVQLYTTTGMSSQQIADVIGVTRRTVQRDLAEAGIEPKTNRGTKRKPAEHQERAESLTAQSEATNISSEGLTAQSEGLTATGAQGATQTAAPGQVQTFEPLHRVDRGPNSFWDDLEGLDIGARAHTGTGEQAHEQQTAAPEQEQQGYGYDDYEFVGDYDTGVEGWEDEENEENEEVVEAYGMYPEM